MVCSQSGHPRSQLLWVALLLILRMPLQSHHPYKPSSIDLKSRHFDVVGIFGRSLTDLHLLASNTLDLSDNSTAFPSKIIYPLDFFPHSKPTHQAMVDDFVGILENFLGTQRVEISLAQRWDQCPPPEANGKPLKQYLAKACSPS